MAAGDTPPQLPPVRHWRVHLGAHKTATTYLQQLMTALRPTLAEKGVDALPVEEFRPVSLERLRRRNWRVWTAGAPMARDLEAALAPLRLGPDVVLISEENLLGSARSAMASPPYPHIDWRLRALASLARAAQFDVFLAIRSMESFLPSVYSQGLRYAPPDTTLDEIVPRLVAEAPRWQDLVSRIAAAMPRARITVWRYEDYRAHAPEILTRLLGLDPGPLPDLSPPASTMTPSAEAVAEAEALDQSLPRREWREAVARIYADRPAGSPGTTRYAPLTAADAARFAALYAEDCAALDAQGRLMRFPATPDAAAGDGPRLMSSSA